MVDATWLAEVKATGDDKPLIKAFTIAHEGNSDIQLDGILTPLKWVKGAVRWIHEKLLNHTPVFNQHGPPGDNSHEGRDVIGEVVGTKLTEVGNRVATIAALYILPAFRHLNLDVASIEADITYTRDGSTVYPTGVDQITGIALANSIIARPGFPEATLLGSIAAFAATVDGGRINAMTIDEVKQAVLTQGIKPSDLFSVTELIAVDAVLSYIKEEKHDVFNQSKRLETENAVLKDEIAKEKNAHATELSKLNSDRLLSSASSVFDTIAGERKLGEHEKSYVGLQLRRFNSDTDNPETFKSEVNKFVDTSLEDFAVVKEQFGVKDDDAGGNDDKGDGKDKADDAGKDKAPDTKSTLIELPVESDIDSKYVDPAQNDYL